MKLKVLFVINPIAGNKIRQDVDSTIRDFTEKQDIDAKIYKTTGDGDEDAIVKIIEEFQPERLVAGGGDGTVQLLGKIAMDKDISLGILPLGSANGLATELELPKQLASALSVATGKETKQVDILQVNEQHCFHMCDLGLNAALVEQYEQGEMRGMAGYALSALRGNFNLVDPFEIKVKLGEEEKVTTTYMAIFTNSRRYGTGVNINPQGKIDDGKFEICLLRKVNLQEVAEILFEEKTKRSDGIYQIHSAAQAEITCNRDVRFQIDGEFIGRVDKLYLKNLPKALEVAVGE